MDEFESDQIPVHAIVESLFFDGKMPRWDGEEQALWERVLLKVSRKYWSREGLSQIPVTRLVCIGGVGKALGPDAGPDAMTAGEFLLLQVFKESWYTLVDVHIDRADLQRSEFKTARFPKER